ncbi:hypothetical protein [Streptomyces sp. NPDC001680]
MSADHTAAPSRPLCVDLVNLTPHPVRLLAEDGTVLADLPPSTPPARRAELTDPDTLLVVSSATVPVVRLRHGPVENLPAPATGTAYVVSRLVADACPDRDDLLVPAQLVRDADGLPIGCQALARGAAR